MDFILILLESQKDFLASVDNAKLVRSHLSELKYDLLQAPFKPMQQTAWIFRVMEIVDRLGTCLEVRKTDYDLDETYVHPLDDSSDTTLQPFLDTYMFGVNTVCECMETVMNSIMFMCNVIRDETTNASSQLLMMLQPMSNLSVILYEMEEIREDVETMFEKFWDRNAEPVRYIVDVIHNSLSEQSVVPCDMQTLICFMNKYKTFMDEPDSLADLTLLMSRNTSVLVTTRVVMQMYLTGQFIDTVTLCRDTITVIDKCEKDETMFEYANMCISTLFNCVIRNECAHVASPLVEKLLFKIIHFITMGGSEVFDNISTICLYFFQHNIELIDGYLIRHVAVSYMTFLQSHPQVTQSVQTKALMSLLERSKYLHMYLASLYDMSTLSVLRTYLSPLFMDMFVERKSHKFTVLESDESATEFHDNITNSFIIHPAVLKVGDSKMWVDAYMMQAHLLLKSENPYTRQPLSIDEWRDYNRAEEALIKQYDKRLKEKLSSTD